ncbi:MAG: hypothetical protein ACRELD_05085 [Longimicrobiales bacterium]
MEQPRAALLALLLVAGLLWSCASTRGWRGEADEAPIYVHVENQNFNDATIYALVRSQRIRLGQVSGHASDVFAIPYSPTDVRFLIDLLASRNFTTAGIVVAPGDELQLVITADLSSSRVIR